MAERVCVAAYQAWLWIQIQNYWLEPPLLNERICSAMAHYSYRYKVYRLSNEVTQMRTELGTLHILFSTT